MFLPEEQALLTRIRDILHSDVSHFERMLQLDGTAAGASAVAELIRRAHHRKLKDRVTSLLAEVEEPDEMPGEEGPKIDLPP